MQQSPGASFDATFTPEAVRPLIGGLKRAYTTACEHHDPDRGGNEATFAFSLYHYAVHELSQASEASGGKLTASMNALVFRLQMGDFELACHRVGHSARQSIWTALPNNEGAAHTMVEEQLWLRGLDRATGLEQARKLVIAHLGNAEEGLGAIYLCVPGATKGERITSWAFAQRIWHADDGFETAPSAPPADLPPDETIEEPKVRRRRDNDTGETREEET